MTEATASGGVAIDVIGEVAGDPSDEDAELIVTVSRKEDRQTTLRSYFRHHWRPAGVAQMGARLRRTVCRANHAGRLDRGSADEMRRMGALLFDDLFPAEVKALLREMPGGPLTLGLSDGLLDIPWEMLHDGRRFLALKWALGRQILHPGLGPRVVPRPETVPPRLLLLADPQGDLAEAYNEGVAVRRLLGRIDGPEVSFQSTRISLADVRQHIREFDIVHFAGHVEREGLRLCDGHFGTREIGGLAGGLPMPRLVFLNGCGSVGHSEAITGSGFVRALIEAGVQHCVGTLYDLPDRLGRDFAIAFYRALAAGRPVGEAARSARLSIVRRGGVHAALWAPYVVYGPPQRTVELGGDADALDDAPEDLELMPRDGASARLQAHLVALAERAPPRLRTGSVALGLSSRTRRLQRSIIQAFAIAAGVLVAILVVLLWFKG